MKLNEFILLELDRVKKAMMKTLEGLSVDELKWRPNSEANSIGIILLDVARSEDRYVSRTQEKPQVWESGKWYDRLGVAESEMGSGYTVQQLATVKVPDLKEMLAYGAAVRSQTVEYMKGMTETQFDRVISTPRLGDVPVGLYLAAMVVHLAGHAGDISYLRGLQRGLDK